jgi:nitric oxide reductase large subunit
MREDASPCGEPFFFGEPLLFFSVGEFAAALDPMPPTRIGVSEAIDRLRRRREEDAFAAAATCFRTGFRGGVFPMVGVECVTPDTILW